MPMKDWKNAIVTHHTYQDGQSNKKDSRFPWVNLASSHRVYTDSMANADDDILDIGLRTED
jgi:hypothetical protein